MEPELLDYYNEELVYMRELAAEFAQMHPKIARRLGMQGITVADPYVERLIEAFSFVSARMRIKLDAEFPRFTQRLLEVVHPNYVSPTPSITVAQFHPSRQEGDLTRGFPVPRNTALFSRVAPGEETPCEFRSGQDITLWPIEITQARLAGTPPDIPALNRYFPDQPIGGSLRLRLRTHGKLRWCDLAGLDRLPLYLCGEESVASHLFELLHTAAVGLILGKPGALAERHHLVTDQAVVHDGLRPAQSLLPLNWTSFHGQSLVHEYFACPSRYYFVTLQHLAAGLADIDQPEVEIVVLLSSAPGSLGGLVDATQFALHCTPIVNLFPKRTDRVEVNDAQPEFHVVPDRSRPLDFEVYAIEEIMGQQAHTTEQLRFRPLYQTLNQDEGNYGRYFSVRRQARLMSGTARRYGTRTPYIGSEVFVSLVDQHEAPYGAQLRHLSVQAWVTNRDLPLLIPHDGRDDLLVSDSIPAARIGLIRPPSKPKPAFAQGEHAWRLIRQLGFNHLPLADLPHRKGAQALRDMLRLFVAADDDVALRQIESLIGTQTTPVTRRLPGAGPLVYGRGVHCLLTVDENGFSGTSPYLFGLVLEQYLARHTAINMFTQCELKSMQRGSLAQWPVRMGSRGVV